MVGYLTYSVETGQIWLATHSLEAVEERGSERPLFFSGTRRPAASTRLRVLIHGPCYRPCHAPSALPPFQFLSSCLSSSRVRKASANANASASLPTRLRMSVSWNAAHVTKCIRRVDVIQRFGPRRPAAGIRIAGIVDPDFRTYVTVSGTS